MAGGVPRGPGRGRLHRRDRRAAGRRRRRSAASRAPARELREYGHGDFSEAIRTTDKFPKEVEVDVALPSGTVRLTAQAKGAGMISPAFATMLCFVQTDAALSAETADLLLGVCVARSFDRHQRRRPALHQRHRDPAGVGRERRGRSSRRREDEARFGEALDWALRKLALDIVRDGEGSKRIGRVVVRGGDDGRGRAASPARSRTRRWSRPRCTAGTRTGAGSRRRSARAMHDSAPLPLDIFIEGVQVCSAGAATRYDVAGLAEAVAGDEVEYDGRAARRRRRGRGLLLRPLARVRDDQRGLHDVMRDVGTPPRGAPVHPGVPRQDGRDQVRRRGDDRPELREDFARDVVLLKYVGLNPIIVHGGGPDITAYMKRLDMPVEFVGGLRVSDADTVEIAKMVLVGKVNKDIVSRINRHGQPAVGLSRRRRPALPRVDDDRARRRGHRLRRARSSASTSA